MSIFFEDNFLPNSPRRVPVAFYCANDGGLLELVSGKFSIFYACPYRKKRNPNGDICNTRLSLKEARRLYKWVGNDPIDGLRYENKQFIATTEVHKEYGYVKVFIQRKKKKTQKMSGEKKLKKKKEEK